MDKTLEKILTEATKKLKTKGLYAIGTGGGAPEGKINLVSLAFNFEKPLNIDNGRRLIVECTNELLEIINKNNSSSTHFEKVPVNTKFLSIAIFSDPSNINNLNQIELVDNYQGKIFYEIINPNNPHGPFLTLHTETFEEAQSILSQKN